MLTPSSLIVLLAAPTASALRVGMAARGRTTARVAGSPSMHCNIYPIFTINDWAAAKPLMDECVQATDTEAGCYYYGWTVNADKTKLFCRETYVDGKAAAVHLANAVPIVGKMLEGSVSLDSIGVMGTEADLADVKEEADKLGCAYWKVWDSFSRFKKMGLKQPAMDKFLTLQPTFTINDLAKAEPFMKDCVEATKKEAGCLYYGWTICDDKLFCREAYVDGKAVDAHLENAVGIVGAMLESGAVSLDKIELHGPSDQWAACKERADALGMVYYDVDDSFAKCSL